MATQAQRERAYLERLNRTERGEGLGAAAQYLHRESFAGTGGGALFRGSKAKREADKGPTLGGSLLSLGSNVLNTLSVPQAALFTTTAKLSGRDLSWKNALGGFRKNAEGQDGVTAALDSMGVTNKSAQLGVSLVADPLWFVGGALVRAPSKAAAIAKTLDESGEAKEGIEAAAQAVGRADRTARTPAEPVGPHSPAYGPRQLGSGRRTPAGLLPESTGPKRTRFTVAPKADEAEVIDPKDLPPALRGLLPETAGPDSFGHKGDRWQDVFLRLRNAAAGARGGQPITLGDEGMKATTVPVPGNMKSKVGKGVNTVTQIGDRHYVYQAKKVRGQRVYKVARRTKHNWVPFSKEYTSKAEAIADAKLFRAQDNVPRKPGTRNAGSLPLNDPKIREAFKNSPFRKMVAEEAKLAQRRAAAVGRRESVTLDAITKPLQQMLRASGQAKKNPKRSFAEMSKSWDAKHIPTGFAKYVERESRAAERGRKALDEDAKKFFEARRAERETARSREAVGRQDDVRVRERLEAMGVDADAFEGAVKEIPEELSEAVEELATAARAQGKFLDEVLEIDDLYRIRNIDEGMELIREAFEKAAAREGMTYGVRFGTKRFGKTFNTGISAERSMIGRGLRGKESFRPGMFAMAGIEKVAHALSRSGAELAQQAEASTFRLAERLGFTRPGPKGTTEFAEDEAMKLQSYLMLRNLVGDEANVLEDQMRAAGLWTGRHDEFVEDSTERMAQIGRQDGLLDAEGRSLTGEGTTVRQDLEDELAEARAALKRHSDAINKQGDEYLKANEADWRAANKKVEDLQERIRRQDIQGPYAPTGKSYRQMKEDVEARDRRVEKGVEVPAAEYYRTRPSDELSGERQALSNVFAAQTADEWIDTAVEAGIRRDDAVAMAKTIHETLEASGLESFGQSLAGVTPEWNAFALAAKREQKHIMTQVEKQVDELMRLHNISETTALGRSLKMAPTNAAAHTISGTKAGKNLQKFMASFKAFLTIVNPAHYTTNAWGDYYNRLINGNARHLGSLAFLPKSRIWKEANADAYVRQGKLDDDALDQVRTITFRDPETGATRTREFKAGELLAMSRMSGLGRGYVGTDINIMENAFEKANSAPGEFWRWAQRMNIKRENAQRMETWIKHMSAGDDPMTAATKMLRVHFDYSELTEFERLWVRNVLLFYTWFKRNHILQATGVVTQPGLYNAAFNNFERVRPKFENEPEYFKHQGAVPIPLLGAIAPGSPWADLMKMEVSMDFARKDLIGMVNPLARVPTEIALNTSAFTGSDIQSYEGQRKPNIFGNVAQHIPGIAQLTNAGPTRAKADGNVGAGLDARVGYFLSQFTGPQVNTVQAVSNPDSELDGLTTWLNRVTGLRMQREEVEKWARAAKYREAKEKAEATRRKNAQAVE